MHQSSPARRPTAVDRTVHATANIIPKIKGCYTPCRLTSPMVSQFKSFAPVLHWESCFTSYRKFGASEVFPWNPIYLLRHLPTLHYAPPVMSKGSLPIIKNFCYLLHNTGKLPFLKKILQDLEVTRGTQLETRTAHSHEMIAF